MINIMRTLIENVEPSIKLIDDNEPLVEEGFNELYKKTVEDINRIYKDAKDKIHENIIMVFEFKNSSEVRDDNTQTYRVHALTMNPVVDLFDNNKFTNYVANAKKVDLNSCDCVARIGLDRSAQTTDVVNCILGEPITTNMTDVVAKQNMNRIIWGLSRISDNIERIKDTLIGELSQCNSEALFKLVYDTAILVLKCEMRKAYALMRSFLEIFQSYSLQHRTLIESVNEEDVGRYVKELREMIPKLREFYDGFKYKEIVTPRKKTINKMDEYMRGALERRYTLKIPIYKVEEASSDAKKIIEERFIKGLDRIVDKYPNYILMTPDFKDDSDMFIYVTLKEPFGDKGDRSNRVQQSKDDGAVIAEGAVGNIIKALGITGAIGTITVWGIINKCKKMKELKKIKIENEADENKFKTQKQKLTAISEIKLKFIKEIDKVIRNAKFVKCKKGTLEAAKKLHTLNTKYIRNITKPETFFESSTEDEYNEYIRLPLKYINERESILSNIEDEWEDANSVNELANIFQVLDNDWVDTFIAISSMDEYKTTDINDDWLDCVWETWEEISKCIKIQIEGDVLSEGISAGDVAALMGGASAVASTTWNIARDIKNIADKKRQEEEEKRASVTEASLGRWEDPDYDMINYKIDKQQEMMDKLGKAQYDYFAKHGEYSPELQTRYEKMCDEMDNLVQKRHEISKKLNEAALTEAALTADKRKSLPDEIFGLPERRAYPLNDKTHIVQAIRMFNNEKDIKNKGILAKNITKQVIKQGLVGKLSISKDNPAAEYFPDWMTSKDARLSVSGKTNVITCNGKTYKYALTESADYSGINFYI